MNKRYWAYLKQVLKHKTLVFKEGWKIGTPLYLLVFHDLSKFNADEFIPYARCYFDANGYPQYRNDVGFLVAQQRHIHRNRHHWEHWCTVTRGGVMTRLPIPKKYMLEMMADWCG